MNPQSRLMTATDRVLAALVVATVLGGALAFGGRVWWAPVALAALVTLMALGLLVRSLLEGRMTVLKSPLTFLGLCAVALGSAQVAPLPASLASKLSPTSRAAYTVGYLPERARILDPTLVPPEAPVNRSPISIDRAATVRWTAGAAACLAVFLTASRFADRLGHLYVVWGSVVAAFFLNTAVAVVQFACRTRGLYGFIQPGRGPAWAPNLNDLLTSPTVTFLRASGETRPDHPHWALSQPEQPYLLGTLMGGPGAYLALASIGLPLALGLTLQQLAPRGSREPLSMRLGQSGRGGLVVLMLTMMVASSALIGLLAGPEMSVLFGLTLVLVGFPSARRTGLRWSAVGLTSLVVGVLGLSAWLGTLWLTSTIYPPPFEPERLSTATRVWAEAVPIALDFPVFGSGLGTFASVYPYYKTVDGATTTAMSSLLQWWVEAGLAGLAVLAATFFWCLFRLPSAVKDVGTADRALAFGLIGAVAGFTLFSAVHWTVELTSVALAASAVAGTCHRWLAGGTDLFVERG
ncbi:MAG: O-antigen ligase family protein [Isosphaeraceae bacterium]